MFKVIVIVKKRPKILDPQGKAVEQGAKLLGFNNVKKTRIGKYIEFFVDTTNRKEADSEVQQYCATMRMLGEKVRKKLGLTKIELSYGMSDDYELAIEEGATMIRLGRALFGSR